ncbi:uncharacterized protein LOC115682490 [Syzygium oleosum]|uniref:uncharacterized protein LOC115682490 n=1 Tax=Syzygium oleosum TaxID=219896 RepID=UPI0024B8DE7D|nr:uncharacterized protein LOC115682490 [Syzygium oleosum]
MPTMRKRARTQGPISTPSSHAGGGGDDHAGSGKISLYEQSREERIRANLERMQKLGIVDLSQKLRSSSSSSVPPPKRTPCRRSSEKCAPVPPSGPVRRSSRLQSVMPISYAEVRLHKKDRSLEDEGIVLEEGSKPEIYTEEHEKLLGNTEKTWEIFVDGCGKDGKRIYDQIRGKTCHQCRQKTLGYRTQCSQCTLVQGQFCGDCLYMRYGEHVLEARQNPNWVCPVCRGICNCSLCRQAKGWPPTGPLYKKVSRLGFKSVAHYLIQTRSLQAQDEKTSDSLVHGSAKRSLPFLDMETVVNASSVLSNDDAIALSESESDPQVVRENSAGHVSVKRSLPFSGKEAHVQSVDDLCSAEYNENCELSKPKCEQGLENGVKDLNVDCTEVVKGPKPVSKRNRRHDPSSDSIAGRLRLRRRISEGNLDKPRDEGKVSDGKNLHDIVMEKDEGEEKEIHCVSD